MTGPLEELIRSYDASACLEQASTPPSAWYTDPRMADLEAKTVFSRSWQVVGRVDQVQAAGQYVTAMVGQEPIVAVRGADGVLRAFFNVCRHHAAAVAVGEQGRSNVLRCPYHGWTYSLSGELKGTPEFDRVCDFDRARNGLLPVSVDTWEQFVWVRLDRSGPSLAEFLGNLPSRVTPLDFGSLRFFERRVYELHCNWKVFVDNYLDGGYHVPHAHKSLNSVLDYAKYRIENDERYCVQSSPMTQAGADAATAAVRGGDLAFYLWIYPNFMINWYARVMDTNLVIPLAVDRTRVVFDFYFDEVSDAAAGRNRDSVAVSDRVQGEDVGICESVQRGLRSRAYDVGRLSVRREAGEHLFHRLLHQDLLAAVEHPFETVAQ